MTKRKKVAIIIVGVIASVIAAALMWAFIPRRLTSLAGVGKLQNVTSIVYKTAPCCGYHEGAEYEYTVTDDEDVSRAVELANDAIMRWTFPIPAAGGVKCELVFRTETGDKVINFYQGKFGSYEFVNDSLLVELARAANNPHFYLDGVLGLQTDGGSLVFHTYAEFLEFAGQEQRGISESLFEKSAVAAVDLGSRSSSCTFYITKVVRGSDDTYTLTIEDMNSNPHTDDLYPQSAILIIPKDLEPTKLVFNIIL